MNAQIHINFAVTFTVQYSGEVKLFLPIQYKVYVQHTLTGYCLNAFWRILLSSIFNSNP